MEASLLTYAILGLACFVAFAAIIFAMRTALREMHNHQQPVEQVQLRYMTLGTTGRKVEMPRSSDVGGNYKIFDDGLDVEIASTALAGELAAFPQEVDLAKKKWSAIKSLSNPSKLLAAETKQQSTLVTILLDQSGSLKEVQSKAIAGAIDSAALMLECANIKFEMIGFTTRNWKGGRPRKIWKIGGQPKSPGRLAEVMYIVYKSADQSYETVRDALALLLIDGIRKENIDGEALLYAHQRFLQSGKPNWLCLTICDGVPADDSTLLANDRFILENHLRTVLSSYRKNPNLRMISLVSGSNRNSSYPDPIYVDAQCIADKLTQQLQSELSQS